MAIDVFKGFGRLKLVVQGTAIAIGAWFMIFYSSSSYLTLETTGPDDTWHRTDKDCHIGIDAVEWIDKIPPHISEKILSITLCFRATEFPDHEMLIPYKVDKTGWQWGDTPYSENVRPYTEHRVREFSFTSQLEKSSLAWAEREVQRKRRENIRSTIITVASIVAILEIFSRIVGWIVRGFIKSNAGVQRLAKGG